MKERDGQHQSDSIVNTLANDLDSPSSLGSFLLRPFYLFLPVASSAAAGTVEDTAAVGSLHNLAEDSHHSLPSAVEDIHPRSLLADIAVVHLQRIHLHFHEYRPEEVQKEQRIQILLKLRLG